VGFVSMPPARARRKMRCSIPRNMRSFERTALQTRVGGFRRSGRPKFCPSVSRPGASSV
jgi:hypothetical protein